MSSKLQKLSGIIESHFGDQLTRVGGARGELVFEVATEEVNGAVEHIRHLMEHATELSIPLVVDIGVGDNWEEAH